MNLTDKQTILKRPVNLQLNLSYEKEHKTMKHKRKFLLSLLALGFLLSCTQTPEQIAEKGSDATVVLFTEDTTGQRTSIGSGFFVRHNQIATNIHVVMISKQKVLAKLVHTEKWFTIEGVTAFDAQNDLVVLQTVEGGAKYLPLGDSDAVQRLDRITVIGSPHRAKESPGEAIEIEIEEGKESMGAIYSPSIAEDSNWLYLRASGIGTGNSGAPVLNSNNEVIGILSKGSSSKSDMAYAIPSNELAALLKRLEPAESLSCWLGKAPIRAWVHFEGGRKKQALSQSTEVIKDLDKAIELYPEFARAYYLRGRVHREIDQYQAAIKDFDETIGLIPNFASAYYHRGEARWMLFEDIPGKREAMLYAIIEDYNKASELKLDSIGTDPRDLIIIAFRQLPILRLSKEVPGRREAVILYAVIKNLDEEIELEGAIKGLLIITRGHVKYILGLSEETLGKKEVTQSLYAAIEDFNEAIELEENATAYYKRGLVYEALGQHKKAKADFEKAKELDPDMGK